MRSRQRSAAGPLQQGRGTPFHPGGHRPEGENGSTKWSGDQYETFSAFKLDISELADRKVDYVQ